MNRFWSQVSAGADRLGSPPLRRALGMRAAYSAGAATSLPAGGTGVCPLPRPVTRRQPCPTARCSASM